MAVGSMGTASLESNASITRAQALTASDSTTYTCGRMFLVIATGAGNVVASLFDGTQLTLPVSTGITLLPFAVQQVWSTGTTATATYYNLV